jgi:hypothetical protein
MSTRSLKLKPYPIHAFALVREVSLFHENYPAAVPRPYQHGREASLSNPEGTVIANPFKVLAHE